MTCQNQLVIMGSKSKLVISINLNMSNRDKDSSNAFFTTPSGSPILSTPKILHFFVAIFIFIFVF
ncbi:hypothetical protein IIV6-T1_006 [Invertebrate iridescent virus 6]|nr:hypothetical protein IIV6-T1_006 [Invertebrate iridescent virus 6]